MPVIDEAQEAEGGDHYSRPSLAKFAAALGCPAKVLSDGHVAAPEQVSQEFAATVVDWTGSVASGLRGSRRPSSGRGRGMPSARRSLNAAAAPSSSARGCTDLVRSVLTSFVSLLRRRRQQSHEGRVLEEVLASTDRAAGRTQDPQDGANQNEDAADRRQQTHTDKQADDQ